MILEAFDQLVAGTYPGGTTLSLGLNEHGVGLVENERMSVSSRRRSVIL